MALDTQITIQDPFGIVKIIGDDHDAKSISKILQKCVQASQGAVPESHAGVNTAFWSAAHYGLDRSTIFNSLSPEQQNEMLKKLGRGILEEAQFIELAGMSYTAKMSLLAGDHQERQLYSFFAADEARHLRLMSDIIGEPQPGQAEKNSFLQYLGKIIRSESRLPLMFLSQIILEGWGLAHYTRLAEHAQDEAVRRSLNSIVADEARHHGSGLVLFAEGDLTSQETDNVEQWLEQFLAMVRIGPYSVIQALASANGGVNESDIYVFLEEVRFEEKIEADLQLMARLMKKSGADILHRRCEAKGLFISPTARATAQKIASSF